MKLASNKHNKIKNCSTCRTLTEDFSSSQNLSGENLWTCSVNFYYHPAHAHFQQTRIDVNYKLDNYANENAKRGYIEIRKGERSFWKALDDSNDPKNV